MNDSIIKIRMLLSYLDNDIAILLNKYNECVKENEELKRKLNEKREA